MVSERCGFFETKPREGTRDAKKVSRNAKRGAETSRCGFFETKPGCGFFETKPSDWFQRNQKRLIAFHNGVSRSKKIVKRK